GSSCVDMRGRVNKTDSRIASRVVSWYKSIDRRKTARMSSVNDNAAALHRRTQQSFGYQWTVFGEMSDQFREDFLNYISPVAPEFFVGKRGLDAGCGFGRHLYYATQFGARMIGLDFSKAITRAKEIAGGLENAQFIQGDLHRPPLRPQSLDFVYSLGVLHHTTNPESA